MEFQDKSLTCVDCGVDFIWTSGEQLFFADKQFKNEPKRCKTCKAKRANRASAGPAPVWSPAVSWLTPTSGTALAAPSPRAGACCQGLEQTRPVCVLHSVETHPPMSLSPCAPPRQMGKTARVPGDGKIVHHRFV